MIHNDQISVQNFAFFGAIDLFQRPYFLSVYFCIIFISVAFAINQTITNYFIACFAQPNLVKICQAGEKRSPFAIDSIFMLSLFKE